MFWLHIFDLNFFRRFKWLNRLTFVWLSVTFYWVTSALVFNVSQTTVQQADEMLERTSIKLFAALLVAALVGAVAFSIFVFFLELKSKEFIAQSSQSSPRKDLVTTLAHHEIELLPSSQ